MKEASAGRVFTIEQLRPIREGMTISRNAGMGVENSVTFFSMGAETSISQERYDVAALYLGSTGRADFLLGEDGKERSLLEGELLVVPGGTLCGVNTENGCVYTEIITKKEITMNKLVKSGEVMKLKDLISYEEGSISNLDMVSNPTMKFVLMAFDEGTGLSPHRAPGNAIIFALEGKAKIGYEGEEYEISEGENFRFEKNGLHSVTAEGRFKMGLLLVLE